MRYGKNMFDRLIWSYCISLNSWWMWMFFGLLEHQSNQLCIPTMSDACLMLSVSWLWPKSRNLTYWHFSQCWIRVDNDRLSDIIRPYTWLNHHSTKSKNIHIHPEMSEIWLKHVWQIVLTVSPLVLGGFECSLACWNINPISYVFRLCPTHV